jgi:amphi-Trp domain-containing protein
MTDSPDDTDRSEEPDGDEDAEFELERAYDRADLAPVFREFAAAFEDGRPVRLNGEDRTVRIAVPERVVAEFEAELEADAEPPVGELELELEWDDADGSSIRVADRDSADDGVEDREETDAADVDAAAAVMPLEGVAGRGSADADADADETAMTADAEDTASADQSSDSGRTSRFEVYEDKGGQWRWRLVHWNGNIVGDSGEGYSSRSNAERAARSVMRSAPTASIRRLD